MGCPSLELVHQQTVLTVPSNWGRFLTFIINIVCLRIFAKIHYF